MKSRSRSKERSPSTDRDDEVMSQVHHSQERLATGGALIRTPLHAAKAGEKPGNSKGVQFQIPSCLKPTEAMLYPLGQETRSTKKK